MKYENKIFIMIMGCIFIFYILFLVFLPSTIEVFLAEFFAGFLGILIAFYLDRQIELRRKTNTSKQIINSLLVELHNNLDSAKSFKAEIKLPTVQRFGPGSPYGSGIAFFDLFKTCLGHLQFKTGIRCYRNSL